MSDGHAAYRSGDLSHRRIRRRVRPTGLSGIFLAGASRYIRASPSRDTALAVDVARATEAFIEHLIASHDGPRRTDPLEGATMKKATALITVDQIEPCLPFWTDALGFELTATVPHEDAMGFAMLSQGGVEIMYQSRSSIDADLGTSGGPADLGARLAGSTTALFIEVESLDPVIDAIGDAAEVVVARRQTFYGMDEIFVQPPCGSLIGFAARVA